MLLILCKVVINIQIEQTNSLETEQKCVEFSEPISDNTKKHIFVKKALKTKNGKLEALSPFFLHSIKKKAN